MNKFHNGKIFLLEYLVRTRMIGKGDCDIVTSTKAISEIITMSKKPRLGLKVIRGSGHIPNAQGMDEI